MKRISFFLLIATALVACRGKYADYDTALQNMMRNAPFDQFSKVIILPRGGCGGCINIASVYAMTNYKKAQNTLFVITIVDDYKRVENTFGPEFMHSSNVKVDSNDYFANDKVKSNYPYILFIKNGKVIKMSLLNNENTATLTGSKL